MVPQSIYAQWVTNNLSSLPLDAIVIGVFTLVIVIASLKWGTQVAAALAFSAPLAVFTFNAVPHTAYISGFVGAFSAGLAAAGLFCALFVAFWLLAFRVIGSYGMTGAYPMQACLGGIAAATVVLVFWFQIPALDTLWHFGSQVQALFAEGYRLFWLIPAFLTLPLPPP